MPSDKIFDSAKMCILDYLGCAYAGAAIQKNQTEELVRSLRGEGHAILIGMKQQCAPMTAALINGINAHKVELDDGHRFAMLHPGTPVISALLAATVSGSFSGDSFLRGIIAGYEAAIRLGLAIQPAHNLRGGHATGTCGAIGAAVAIAVAGGFDKKQMKDAIAAACASASGLLKMVEDDSQLKPYNVGHAALSGYVSAYMGTGGFSAPLDPLSGKRGFLHFMTDGNYDESQLCNNRDKYCIEEIYIKPYASCRHSHPSIEAALCIISKHGIVPNHISGIEARVYELAITGHDHTEVYSSSAARMSIPYAIATAIVNKEAGLREFDESAIQNAETLNLAKKVTIVADEELTTIFPTRRAAIVRIESNGQVYEHRVDYPLGEPENPMTPKAIENKFRLLATSSGLCEQYTDCITTATKHIDIDFEKWIDTVKQAVL